MTGRFSERPLPDPAAAPSTGRFSDLDRPPLNQRALSRALTAGPGPWTSVEVVAATGSTHADLVERARAGAPEGTVLVAEEQTAGRGRLGRPWNAPPRSALHVSVLLRPGDGGPEAGAGAAGAPPERWGWLPLLAGVAAVESLGALAEVDTALKWPNDVLVAVDGEHRKLAGILAERVGDAVVLGIGVNVSLRADELPVATAGSLALAGAAVTDRDPLLRALLRGLGTRYTRWRSAAGDPDAAVDPAPAGGAGTASDDSASEGAAGAGSAGAEPAGAEPAGAPRGGGASLREAYQRHCATLGRRVRAELPGDRVIEGEAVGVDADGRLRIRSDGGEVHALDAGDITHLRAASGGYTP